MLALDLHLWLTFRDLFRTVSRNLSLNSAGRASRSCYHAASLCLALPAAPAANSPPVVPEPHGLRDIMKRSNSQRTLRSSRSRRDFTRWANASDMPVHHGIAPASAYRRMDYQLSKKYHPDAPGGSSERFVQINDAYGVLGDEGKRCVPSPSSFGRLYDPGLLIMRYVGGSTIAPSTRPPRHPPHPILTPAPASTPPSLAPPRPSSVLVYPTSPTSEPPPATWRIRIHPLRPTDAA